MDSFTLLDNRNNTNPFINTIIDSDSIIEDSGFYRFALLNINQSNIKNTFNAKWYKLVQLNEFSPDSFSARKIKNTDPCKNNKPAFKWFIDLINLSFKEQINSVAYEYLIASISAQAVLRGHNYHLGTAINPIELQLENKYRQNNYIDFCFSLTEVLNEIKHKNNIRYEDMFIMYDFSLDKEGDSGIKTSDIFKNIVNGVHTQGLKGLLTPHIGKNNKKIYPIIFGYNKAYTHNIQLVKVQYEQFTKTPPYYYHRLIFNHGSACLRPEALGIAYITVT